MPGIVSEEDVQACRGQISAPSFALKNSSSRIPTTYAPTIVHLTSAAAATYSACCSQGKHLPNPVVRWGVSLEDRVTALSCEIGVRQAGTRQVWVTEPTMLVDTVGGVKCAQTALHFLLGSFGTSEIDWKYPPRQESPSALWMKIELSEKK